MLDVLATLNAIRERTAQAVIGQSGLAHPGLAAEVRRRLSDPDPDRGGVLQQPVVEAALPYVSAERTMAELAGGLLRASLVDALDGANARDKRNYRFLRTWRPHAHQLEAWEILSKAEPQSVLVTSGTGSGKTECFLVPILNDLAAQAETEGPLEGVQAVVLYPLNALIASQEERLREWTAPFRGDVRFALYNGQLPDQVEAREQRARPEAVLDRKTLRADPPPILVTNVTMLEYMLLRPVDAPILEKSKGKLRYVVLDEAHTYVGAQAAEIALLLRRVCLAFGVEPAQVRFVATSATIGKDGDVDDVVDEHLRRFLADVSGAPANRVHLVKGRPRSPALPAAGPARTFAPGDLAGLDAAERFDALAAEPRVRRFVEMLYGERLPWTELDAVARDVGLPGPELADALTTAEKAGDGLAPLRVHAFHRAIPGLWSCLNPACSGARPEGWPFGALLTNHAERCSDCGGAVFEIAACGTCGEPFLSAEESADGRRLRPAGAGAVDEFAFDAETPLDDEDTETEPAASDVEEDGVRRLLAARAIPRRSGERPATRLFSDAEGRLTDSPSEAPIELLAHAVEAAHPSCPACGAGDRHGADPVRSIKYGAPFILGNATPLLLDSAAPADGASDPAVIDANGARPPARGRQLLSFTDSRQGTARLSAKLQVASERNFVRSVIYHTVQDALAKGADPAAADKLDTEIATLEPLAAGNDAIAELVRGKREERAALDAVGLKGLAWTEMVDRLAARDEVRVWIKKVWEPRGLQMDDARFADERHLAHFLLLREFLRRPPRANSVETLGLARLYAPQLDRLRDADVPSFARERGLAVEDWRAFLQTLLTHFVRERAAVHVDQRTLHWMRPHARTKDLILSRPDRTRESWEVVWPFISSGGPRLGPVAALLMQATKANRELAGDREGLNDCFERAWSQLRDLLAETGSIRNALSFAKLRVAPVTDAWWCPVTRRVLDVAVRGLTPYGAKTPGTDGVPAERITTPRHPAPLQASSETTHEWLAADEHIQALRARGAWTDLSDRIALFSDYFRSAEHSAQQPPYRLRRYETEFRQGAINVLNCSTTMEMGVDIGSVSHVMMTNVPPSIASYRQRVGRAGRRRQSLSLAFTFCKDRPLDRDAFDQPLRFLGRPVRAPKVALDSRVIVQRHVNAYLFAAFARERGADAVKLEAGRFFGCPAPIGEPEDLKSAAAEFVPWAASAATQQTHGVAVAHLVRGSVLAGDGTVFQIAADAMASAQATYRTEWEALRRARVELDSGEAAAQRQLELQLKRLCGDYLLGVLADRGFLPGHGFPTDVVSFVVKQKKSERTAVEEQSRFQSHPQRQLEVAIREYAPGSEVVLDGLVHRSAGVTLNWKRPAGDDDAREVQSIRRSWRCAECGESGVVGPVDYAPGFSCPVCTSEKVQAPEYLKPAGFAADWREDAHADADVVTHVPAEPPEVSAAGAPWTALFDPTFGRRRPSREGKVFFRTRGPTQTGYDVCLCCGRAQPAAPAPEQGGEVRWSHKPLSGKPDVDGLCEGSNRVFAVKRGVELGREMVTDVFEFQPSGLTTRGAALALASAMREALARQLGIEPEEMGLAAERRRDARGQWCFSAFLFDRSAGGAGFAVTADELLPEVLAEAGRILDCPRGCAGGCPACVLTNDMTESEARTLDRTAAMEAVTALTADIAPSPNDVAGPNARLCADLIREVERLATSGATVTLSAGSITDIAGATDWRGALLVRKLRDRGVRVVLAVEGGPEELDGAQRLRLRDRLSALDAELSSGRWPTLANAAAPLAEVAGATSTVAFATRDLAAPEPGADWGLSATHALVRFEPNEPLWTGSPVPKSSLREDPGAALVHLKTELDGPAVLFGPAAAKRLKALCEKLGVWGELKAVAYEDRYVSSPLVAKLLLDTVAALTEARSTPLILVTRPVRPHDRPPHDLRHDWSSDDARASVMQTYAQAKQLQFDLRVGEPPHGRRLTLRFADGRGVRLLLDQGFGAWTNDRRVRYDFQARPEAQARSLSVEAGSVRVLNRETAGTYVVAEAMAAAVEPA